MTYQKCKDCTRIICGVYLSTLLHQLFLKPSPESQILCQCARVVKV